jgi:hypothetical protein
MGTITSPVEKFPGTIELPDALSWDQLATWDEGLDKCKLEVSTMGILRSQVNLICALGFNWHLKGIDEHPQTLPTKPMSKVVDLVSWVMGEVIKLTEEDSESKNA